MFVVTKKTVCPICHQPIKRGQNLGHLLAVPACSTYPVKANKETGSRAGLGIFDWSEEVTLHLACYKAMLGLLEENATLREQLEAYENDPDVQQLQADLDL